MDYLSTFIEMLQARNLTPNTIRSYITYIKPYLEFLSSLNILPEDASWQVVRDYLRWIKAQRCLSDRTVNMIISYLQFFWIYVLHKSWDKSQVPFRKFDSYLPFVPDRKLVRRFLDSLDDPKAYLAVSILYSTGMRLDEIKSEVDVLANQILQNKLGISVCPDKEHSPRFPIQEIFLRSYDAFCQNSPCQSDVQKKSASAITKCKSGSLGCNISICEECGHTEIHHNSCRNRSCPNCQAVLKEVWVDKRRSEVIDSPYFHVVFTLLHELNPLLYCNQKLLYSLLHKCCAETLLELCQDKKYLGAIPGIIPMMTIR